MTEKDPNRPTYPFDEDISLFDIWHTLWRGKIFIIGISAIFVLFSILYLLPIEQQYESEIFIDFRLSRPDSLSSIALDIRDLFEDKKTYNEWAKPDSVLQFSHIDKTADIEGFLYALDEGNPDITVAMVNRKKYFFIIRDKDADLIADVKNYADFLNEKLTDEYKRKTLADLALLDEQIELAKQGENFASLVQTRLKFKKYLAELEAGKKALRIHLPTPPRSISSNNPKVTVIIAAILGGIIGCGLVLVYDGYKTYRQNKATTA
ncbi:MAG: Wzz/FepE/Etk N-terminal domain-containing protein [Alphaproteobacteria bacterium]|nr:Wzz/FepE/Etk N-terminal domain-containing protein [Alphaproteobacteria bacterium]